MMTSFFFKAFYFPITSTHSYGGVQYGDEGENAGGALSWQEPHKLYNATFGGTWSAAIGYNKFINEYDAFLAGAEYMDKF